MTYSRHFLNLHWPLAAIMLLMPLSSGCAQFVLLGLLLGGPPLVEPDFDRMTGKSILEDDECIVAVVCWAPLKLQYDHPNIHNDVAQYVSHSLAHNEISTIAPTFVQAWIDQHPNYDESCEVGHAFEAKYVIQIDLENFSLHEPNSVELLRGRTVAMVTVIEMQPDGSGDAIYETEIDFLFPTRSPREASNTPYTQFKMEYLTALSDKITWLFVPRETGAQIPWAT